MNGRKGGPWPMPVLLTSVCSVSVVNRRSCARCPCPSTLPCPVKIILIVLNKIAHILVFEITLKDRWLSSRTWCYHNWKKKLVGMIRTLWKSLNPMWDIRRHKVPKDTCTFERIAKSCQADRDSKISGVVLDIKDLKFSKLCGYCQIYPGPF